MDFVSIGLLISGGFVAFLILVFRHEQRSGRRILEGVRSAADRGVLRSGAFLTEVGQFIGRNFVRQIIHYIFHRFLGVILRTVENIEGRLRTVMRVNKNLARTVERESAERTKLEEIALHKAASALTEAEKRTHKERALRGL